MASVSAAATAALLGKVELEVMWERFGAAKEGPMGGFDPVKNTCSAPVNRHGMAHGRAGVLCAKSKHAMIALARTHVVLLLTLIAPLHLAAQQRAELYEFDKIKYQVSNWPVNDMMHVLIEKYGVEHVKQQRDLDSLLARVQKERYAQDVAEFNDHSSMPPVQALLGFYAGIDATSYAELASQVKAGKVAKADSILKKALLPKAEKDTLAARDSLATLNALAGTELGSLLKWVKLNNQERDTSRLKPIMAKVRSALKQALLDTCESDTDSMCVEKLRKILTSARSQHEKRHNAMIAAVQAMNKGGKPMVDAWKKTVEDRLAEIKKPYAVKPEVLDSLAKACVVTSSDGCMEMRGKMVAIIKKELAKTAREFTCALPIADYRSFFVQAFTEALMALASDSADKKEAERLAEVNFYRILTIVIASPTPDAGELCVNRELMVYRRKPVLQVWAERKSRHATKRHPGVIIKGWRKRLVRKDSLISKRIVTIRKNGKSGPQEWSAIAKRIKESPRLSARFKVDSVTNPNQLLVIRRQKYYRKQSPERLRHYRMGQLFASSFDSHDRFPFEVDHVAIKFEDGVIEGITVDGTIHETFRFLMPEDGGHVDSVMVPHHWRREGVTPKVVHRSCKITFNNSNTPIPFGNVWNFFERFIDHMPLYGYSAGSGVQRKGSGELDYVLMLSDLLHYDPRLQKATANIAPGDTIITIDFRRSVENGSAAGSVAEPGPEKAGGPSVATGMAPNSANPVSQLCAGLKKDDLRRIGEFRVYTDLVGLAREKPNGILQSEYAWRIPILPRRNQGVNFISHAEPSFTLVLHEAEEIKAYMGLDSLTAPQTAKRQADPLDLLATSTYRVGMRITATQLSMRYLNSEIELNPFCFYNRTLARDSVQRVVNDSVFVDSTNTYAGFERSVNLARDIDGIGSFTWGGELRWKMRPDGRFGFDLYFGVARHSILDTRFGFDGTGWDRPGSYRMNMSFCGLDAHLFASDTQKLFFKFRWIGDLHHVDDNFVQLMFGYNRNLKLQRGEEEKTRLAAKNAGP